MHWRTLFHLSLPACIWSVWSMEIVLRVKPWVSTQRLLINSRQSLIQSEISLMTISTKTRFFRTLLPSQLTMMREVKLKDPCSVYVSTNSVHKSSSILNIYQCSLQSTKQNMLADLLSQIISEKFFTQLRTKVHWSTIFWLGTWYL